MSASSSATLRVSSPRIGPSGSAGMRSRPSRMRASGVRSSCEQLASSSLYDWTSSSIRSAERLKLRARAATSSRPPRARVARAFGRAVRRLPATARVGASDVARWGRRPARRRGRSRSAASAGARRPRADAAVARRDDARPGRIQTPGAHDRPARVLEPARRNWARAVAARRAGSPAEIHLWRRCSSSIERCRSARRPKRVEAGAAQAAPRSRCRAPDRAARR
jgi:hypothetical protein